jgi:hypothetical protein
MAIILDMPPVLRHVFGDEGSSALINVFNQYETVLRDGVERMLTTHRQALQTTVDERFQHIEGSLKILVEKSATEQKRYADTAALELKQSMDELKTVVEKLAIEQKQYSDKLALEQRQYTDHRFNELERKMMEKLVEVHEKLADVRGSLSKEIAESKSSMIREIAESKSSMIGEIAESKSSMIGEIAESKSSMIKWMFSFFVGSIITILGVLIAYLQLYLTKLNLP